MTSHRYSPFPIIFLVFRFLTKQESELLDTPVDALIKERRLQLFEKFTKGEGILERASFERYKRMIFMQGFLFFERIHFLY